MTARFTFVGTPIIPKENAKRPFYKEFTKNDKNMVSINFGIKESDINMAFVEAFDTTKETIVTTSTDGDKLQIDWSDRLSKEIISEVANYRKYTVDLGEDYGGRKTFITAYDMIQFLNENLRAYKGKLMVTGQFTRDWYKDQYYDKFRVQNVYTVDETDYKNRLSLSMDIFYNKESIDKSDFKEDKKIYLNGYIEQYINKTEGKKMLPMQLVFSAAKYNMANEKHKKLYDYKMSYIDTKSKNYIHIPWDIVLVRGAEETEFDESMLTAKQKEQIELGLRTLEDFKPKGIIVGDRINEYRLLNPKLTGDFADGVLEVEDTPAEFAERIYQPPQDETLEQAIEISQKHKEEPEEIEEDDLF